MWFVICMNALFFIFLGSIWKADTFLNVSLKILSWLLAGANLIIILHESGYIVKVH